MKKFILLLMFCLMPLCCGCQLIEGAIFIAMIEADADKPGNLTDREDVIALYRDNEELFRTAAETNRFTDMETIKGVSMVEIKDDYVRIECGSMGLSVSGSAYGIYYSETDDLCALPPFAPSDPKAYKESGNGYLYDEHDSLYVEPLGNHYFYYEERW